MRFLLRASAGEHRRSWHDRAAPKSAGQPEPRMGRQTLGASQAQIFDAAAHARTSSLRPYRPDRGRRKGRTSRPTRRNAIRQSFCRAALPSVLSSRSQSLSCNCSTRYPGAARSRAGPKQVTSIGTRHGFELRGEAARIAASACAYRGLEQGQSRQTRRALRGRAPSSLSRLRTALRSSAWAWIRLSSSSAIAAGMSPRPVATASTGSASAPRVRDPAWHARDTSDKL